MPNETKPVDEFHGEGGSYVVGKRGKRELVERTKDRREDTDVPRADTAVPLHVVDHSTEGQTS